MAEMDNMTLLSNLLYIDGFYGRFKVQTMNPLNYLMILSKMLNRGRFCNDGVIWDQFGFKYFKTFKCGSFLYNSVFQHNITPLR